MTAVPSCCRWLPQTAFVQFAHLSFVLLPPCRTEGHKSHSFRLGRIIDASNFPDVNKPEISLSICFEDRSFSFDGQQAHFKAPFFDFFIKKLKATLSWLSNWDDTIIFFRCIDFDCLWTVFSSFDFSYFFNEIPRVSTIFWRAYRKI